MSTPALWVRGEAFCFGTLTGTPHSRLSISNIRKIIAYSKNKGQTGYPQLHYSIWRHIACNKLQITEEHAWMYFESYMLLADELPLQRKRQVLNHLAGPNQRGADNSEYLSSLHVDTLRFVLFLYAQQLNKISFRSSFIAGDEWPTQPRSSVDLDSSSRSSTGSVNKHTDENSQHIFFMQHMSELLELLAEPSAVSGQGTPAPGSELALCEASVQALGFLVDGCLEKGRKLSPLLTIATEPSVASKNGYVSATRSFAFKPFQTWLRSTMGPSPYGVSMCISMGKRLSWLPPDHTGAVRRGKVGTNTHLVHRADIKGNKLIIMTQISKQMVARSSGTLEEATVKLHRCTSAFFYLLSGLRAVSIEKCRNCLVVLGPVQLTVYVTHCEGVKVIAPCARLVVASSHDCVLHPLTLTRPLLLGTNERLTLGPYNTWYGQEGQHLYETGLAGASGGGAAGHLWKVPLVLGGGESGGDKVIWEVMKPSDFHVLVIPFEMEGPTKGLPCTIPPEYSQALAQRESQVESWQRGVQEKDLDKKDKDSFQALVEQRFQEWLAETGAKKELEALLLHIDAAVSRR